MMVSRFIGVWLGFSVAISGCGAVESPGDSPDPDAPGGAAIRIAGRIAEGGVSISAAATVDVIQISSGETLASAVSGPDGRYAVAVPARHTPLDAYLAVSSPGHLRTHVYLEPRLGADRSAYVAVFREARLRELAISAGASQPPGTGVILAQLFDHDGPVAEARASVLFGPSCYSKPADTPWEPDCTLSETASDGHVWFFAAPPGPVTVSGALADETPLRSRQVRVEANVVVEVGLEP